MIVFHREKKDDLMKVSPSKRLRKIFTISVTSILLFITAVTLISFYLLINLGVLDYEYLSKNGLWIITLFIIVGVLLGSLITFGISRLVLKPAWAIMTGIKSLSKGDYSVRIDAAGSYETKELANNFNALATELENTNILRSDFINNFSHEFKTPIVSMRGLIDLLKKDNVPQEKRHDYLKIISEELDRLSNMATNILNLSKIENQSILTDVSTFNVSEQIRTCILLLEKKWSKKDIDLKLDFDEFNYRGNEDLLKQVWINLLDNAIKFSFLHGIIEVKIDETPEFLTVKISNSGETIPKEEFKNIFNKFYQKDKSAMSEGNGIGLSVVSHIVKLHKGKITVESENGFTTFTVNLSKAI